MLSFFHSLDLQHGSSISHRAVVGILRMREALKVQQSARALEVEVPTGKRRVVYGAHLWAVLLQKEIIRDLEVSVSG